LALSRGRGISRYGEHLGALKNAMTIEDRLDTACVMRLANSRLNGVGLDEKSNPTLPPFLFLGC
jgi:hypothetical protein